MGNDSEIKGSVTTRELATEPSGEMLRHTVVMSSGPGDTRMLELERLGPARMGIKAWIEGEPVVWLTTDKSALIPITKGTHDVVFEISGSPGNFWRIQATKPAGAVGGSQDNLPPRNQQPVVGVIAVEIP